MWELPHTCPCGEIQNFKINENKQYHFCKQDGKILIDGEPDDPPRCCPGPINDPCPPNCSKEDVQLDPINKSSLEENEIRKLSEATATSIVQGSDADKVGYLMSNIFGR